MTSHRDSSRPVLTWPSRPVTIDLTLRHQPHRPARPDAWLRGRLCYLSRLDAVVQPTHPVGERWRCLVVAHRQPGHGSYTTVDGDDLAAAPTTITVDDEAGFVVAWLCTAWQYWCGGTTQLAARCLAEDLRQPGTLAVDLDPAALRRLASVTRLRTPGLRRLLARFVDAALIRHTGPGPTGGWGLHTLTLPLHPAGTGDAPVPGTTIPSEVAR